MTVLDQITRPFGWLRVRNQPRTTVAQKAAAGTTPATKVTQSLRAAQPIDFSDYAVRLPSRMNATCYQEVLEFVMRVYTTKGQELVLDLSDVKQLELTGIFALHCIALIMRGETIPDPANGWSAMRAAAERNLAAGVQENLKLYNPSAPIEALLRANHFHRLLIIEPQNDPGK